MSSLDDLLKSVEIPRMAKVRQTFPDDHVSSPAEELRRKFRDSGAGSQLKKGQTAALAVGSRGVADLPVLVRTLAEELKRIGVKPLIIPAMGSHGGATGEGQRSILEEMGVTEAFTGAPIRSSMETVFLGTTESGLPVYMDKHAYEADAVIAVNRIHPHVSYRGRFESGLMKMIAIGLGKLKGANICHDLGFASMHKNVPEMGAYCLAHGNILCGVAVVENAYHQVHTIEVLPGSEIEQEEPRLLELAKELEPCLYFDTADVLIIDEIGKNISGTGFDTNIVGRYGTSCISGGPQITKISVLDVTDVSHGNCSGLGLADFTTRRVFDKFSFENTYPNSLTSTAQAGIKIPMVLKNDLQAVQAAVKTCNIPDKSAVRLIWMKNTLEIDTIWISEAMIEEAQSIEQLTLLGKPEKTVFDRSGNVLRSSFG